MATPGSNLLDHTMTSPEALRQLAAQITHDVRLRLCQADGRASAWVKVSRARPDFEEALMEAGSNLLGRRQGIERLQVQEVDDSGHVIIAECE